MMFRFFLFLICCLYFPACSYSSTPVPPLNVSLRKVSWEYLPKGSQRAQQVKENSSLPAQLKQENTPCCEGTYKGTVEIAGTLSPHQSQIGLWLPAIGGLSSI